MHKTSRLSAVEFSWEQDLSERGALSYFGNPPEREGGYPSKLGTKHSLSSALKFVSPSPKCRLFVILWLSCQCWPRTRNRSLFPKQSQFCFEPCLFGMCTQNAVGSRLNLLWILFRNVLFLWNTIITQPLQTQIEKHTWKEVWLYLNI